MSKKKNSNYKNTSNKTDAKKKKKTPLMIGATISNWLSFALMIIGLIMVGLKMFNVIPVSWEVAWAPFLAGVTVGIVWFIFVMIMINVFKKK